MLCPGPYEKFVIEGDKEEDMKKASVATGSNREKLGSTGSTGSAGMSTTPNSANRTAGASGSSNMDTKIDWTVKTIKELKEETACNREVKMIIKEVVREKIENIKQEGGSEKDDTGRNKWTSRKISKKL